MRASNSGHEAFGLAEQRKHQMLAVHFLMRMFAREALRVLQRLLRFLGQLVELHGVNLTQRRHGAKMGNFSPNSQVQTAG